MAIKLKIKKREEKLNISIPLSLAKSLIEKESKDELWDIKSMATMCRIGL